MDFDVPADLRVKVKEIEKKDKYLNLARELKNALKHEGDIVTKCSWCTRKNSQEITTGTGRLGNKRKSEDHPNYRIIKISKNTEESPSDLQRFAVTQTPGKYHQLTLV